MSFWHCALRASEHTALVEGHWKYARDTAQQPAHFAHAKSLLTGYNFRVSKASTIIILGLFSALVPFTGFPIFVKTTASIIAGVLIMIIAFLVREERLWLLKELGSTDAGESGRHESETSTFEKA